MERRQLEYFLAVVDHGGFTVAATALRISQPALSYAIKMLEKDLGTFLFHRLPRGVKLTEAGAEFAESARLILREFETARSRVEAVAGLVAGRLDVVSLPGLLVDPLAAAVRQFRARHPDVRIRILQLETPAAIRDAVRSGATELGLTDELEDADRDVTGDLIAEQEMVAVLPPGSPVPPDGVLPVPALLKMDLVTAPPGTVIRDLVTREGLRLGYDVRPVVEVSPRGSTLYLAMAGVGVTVLPRPLAELARPHGAVIVPLDPPKSRDVYLLHRTAPLSPGAQAMHALLGGHVPPPANDLAAAARRASQHH